MTIQEAIRECEGTLESARKLKVEKPGFKLPGHDHYVDFLETLLAAAKKGAAEEIKIERDKDAEKFKELTMETVARSLAHVEKSIGELESNEICMMIEGTRFGLVIEPVLHTAAAALRKAMDEMVAAGVDNLVVGNGRIVRVDVNTGDSMEKILKHVEGDLEKIFREAAQGKKEEENER